MGLWFIMGSSRSRSIRHSGGLGLEQRLALLRPPDQGPGGGARRPEVDPLRREGPGQGPLTTPQGRLDQGKVHQVPLGVAAAEALGLVPHRA